MEALRQAVVAHLHLKSDGSTGADLAATRSQVYKGVGRESEPSSRPCFDQDEVLGFDGKLLNVLSLLLRRVQPRAEVGVGQMDQIPVLEGVRTRTATRVPTRSGRPTSDTDIMAAVTTVLGVVSIDPGRESATPRASWVSVSCRGPPKIGARNFAATWRKKLKSLKILRIVRRSRAWSSSAPAGMGWGCASGAPAANREGPQVQDILILFPGSVLSVVSDK